MEGKHMIHAFQFELKNGVVVKVICESLWEGDCRVIEIFNRITPLSRWGRLTDLPEYAEIQEQAKRETAKKDDEIYDACNDDRLCGPR